MERMLSRRTTVPINAKSDGVKLYIQKHCWEKMHGWCKAANSEVSGLGLAQIVDGIFVVSDVFLPKQYCSGAATELDDIAKGALNYHLYQKNKRYPKMVRIWWHTHYNFDVFWSGTDDDCSQLLAQTNGEWSVSLVINQAGDWLARADFVKPVRLTIDEIPVFLIENTEKRKPYTRFERDIKKWVLPMSKNKNKPLPGAEVHQDNEIWGKAEQLTQQPKHDITKYVWKDREPKSHVPWYLEPEYNSIAPIRQEEVKPVVDVPERFGRYFLIPPGDHPNGSYSEFAQCVDEDEYARVMLPKAEEKKACFCGGANLWCRECYPEKEAQCTCPHTADITWETCICNAQCNECLETMFY